MTKKINLHDLEAFTTHIKFENQFKLTSSNKDRVIAMFTEIVEKIENTKNFNESQIISIYYQVKCINKVNLKITTRTFDFTEKSLEGKLQAFRLIPLHQLQDTM